MQIFKKLFDKEKPNENDQKAHQIQFLSVPYAEKDQVKELGARWHADQRKWFVPKGLDVTPFKQWLPLNESNVETQIFPTIYLLSSYESCWRCQELTSVYTFACSGIKTFDLDLQKGHFFTLSYIEFLPKILLEIIQAASSRYYTDYSKTTKSNYYMNHCQCGAKLGDFYMYSEPGGAFFPINESDCKGITLKKLDIHEPVPVECSYHSPDCDLILRYAKSV